MGIVNNTWSIRALDSGAQGSSPPSSSSVLLVFVRLVFRLSFGWMSGLVGGWVGFRWSCSVPLQLV